MTRTLLLLRHAEAEATRPGFRDRDRRLTERGLEQATAVGGTIRTAGWAVDHVLCSPAVRTQQTLAGLALSGQPTVELVDALYDAGSDSIIELIQTLPASAACALVVGHAPGVPAVLRELGGTVNRYPPASIATLTVADWGRLDGSRVVRVELG